MNTNAASKDHKQLGRTKFALALLITFAYPIVTAVIGVIGGDILVLQKIATRWLYPIGLVYLVAMFATIIGLQKGEKTIAWLGSIILLVCIVSTDPVVRWVAMPLENRYPEWVPSIEAPFDTAIVLGGGTGLTPRMRPQMNFGGERLGWAARLYHAGAIKKIVVTGDALISTGDPIESPQAQAIAILTGLDVPAAAITGLQGRSTFEEIQSLKAQPELWKGKRCGLITSAIHLTRAMKLAKAAEVDVIPVQANYQYPNGAFTALDLIPDAENTFILQQSIHEYLGMLIGR